MDLNSEKCDIVYVIFIQIANEELVELKVEKIISFALILDCYIFASACIDKHVYENLHQNHSLLLCISPFSPRIYIPNML